MEKRILLLFLVITFILLNIISITAITGESITGYDVTGKASSQPMEMSIFVMAVAPSLTIISPKNETYFYNESLLLNYTATNADNIWYNLDLQENITITSPVYFNTSQGSHTLYLYANNSQGDTTTNVSFTVNLTRFLIFYDKYKDRGNTTNFTLYTYEELQNSSNIILENDYGKIVFNQAINMTNDSTPADNILDIDNNTNISSNRIELNSTSLPNFNVSATLWLYNLTFTNPRILLNNEVCPSTICTDESYNISSGILKFNVTSLALYSAEETPSAPTPAPSAGRPSVRTVKDFKIDKTEIRVSLKQGETKKETLIIQNTGTERLKINISTELKDFIKISEGSFDLNRGESKIIILDILAGENTTPNLYIGKLKIEAGEIKKEVLVSIEVESKEPLFDIKVEIPSRFFYVLPGEDVMANIILYSLGKAGRVDVKLEYEIRSQENITILHEEETVAVEIQASFVKDFHIPKDTKYGAYVLYVKAVYDGKTASATAWFNVGKMPFFTPLLIILIILAIILLIIWYELRKIRKHITGKIDENVLVKEKLIKLKGGGK